MASAGSIYVDLDLNGEKYKLGLTKASGQGSAFAKKQEQEFKTMSANIEGYMKNAALSIGAYFSASAIKNYVESSIKAFADHEDAVNRLNLSLASTGKYTLEASEHFQQLSESIAGSTRSTRDQVLQITGYLAQMTNLRGEMLDKATKATIGLSSVLPDRSPQDIALAIGKGMMGNMKALQRMGIYNQATGDPFKDQQEMLDRLLPLYERAENDTRGLNFSLGEVSKSWNVLKDTIGESITSLASASGVLKGLSDTLWGINWILQQMKVDPQQKIKSEISDIDSEITKLGKKTTIFGFELPYNEGYKKSRTEELLNKKLLLSGQLADLSKEKSGPPDISKIYNPIAKPDPDTANKAKHQAEQYASIMASIGGKWLEATQGIDAQAVALQKVDVMCDKYAFDLQKAGINGENLRVAMEAIESLRTFEKQNIDLKVTEEATAKYDEMMQSIGEKWLEATQGTNAYKLALQKIDNEYDKEIEKLSKIKNLTEDQRKNIQDALKSTKDAKTEKLNKDISNEALGSMFDALGGAVGGVGKIFESNRGGMFGGIANLVQSVPKQFKDWEKIGGQIKTPSTATMGKIGMFSSLISGMADSYAAGGAAGDPILGAITGAVSMGVTGAMAGFALAGGGAAAGAESGAAAGSAITPGVGTAIGAVIGVIVGGVMGFLGGGGSAKKPPSKEELEASKMKDEELQLANRGFLQPMYSKGEMAKDPAIFKEYIDAMKNIDKQLSDAIAKGLAEGLKQPTAQAAVDEFNKNFAAGFSNIFIATASQSLDKLMKIMIAPMTQVVEDAVFMIERKAQDALKPAYGFILETYKSINNAVGALFDQLNAGLKSISAAIPGLGEALGGGVYALLMLLIPIIVSVFSELLAALAKVAEKIFEPVLLVIFQITRAFEKLFDVRPAWIEEMERAGITLSDALGSDAVNKMEDAWGKIKGVISDALKAAFDSGNADTAYENFCRKFKEGIYKFMVEGLIQALAAGAIILPAIAPFITDYVALIAKAMTGGKIDPKELSRIFSGISTNIKDALGESEGVIKDIFDECYNFKNDLLGADSGATAGTDAGPPADVTAKVTGWDAVWQRVKTMWDDFGKFIEGVLVSVDAVFTAFMWGLGGFLNAVLQWIWDVLGIKTGDKLDEPGWVTFIKDAVHLLFGWIEDLWALMTGQTPPENHDPDWVVWIKQSLHYLFGWIEDTWCWILGIQPPADTTFATMKPQWAVDFEKFLGWAWDGLVGIWNWIFPPPSGDPAALTATRACVTAIGDALATAWNFITAPFTAIFSAINAVLQWVSAAVNSVIIEINKILNGVGLPSVSQVSGHNFGTVAGSYATGTNYVPQTGLYQLHQGEAVVPAGQNNGQAGGGVTVYIAQMVIREEMDIKRVARELGWHIEQQMRGAITI